MRKFFRFQATSKYCCQNSRIMVYGELPKIGFWFESYLTNCNQVVNVDYSLTVWGSTTPSVLKPIQTLKKKQGKCHLRSQTTQPTETLFQKLHILHFEKLKLLKTGIFMWKVLNDKVPQTLKDHFSI